MPPSHPSLLMRFGARYTPYSSHPPPHSSSSYPPHPSSRSSRRTRALLAAFPQGFKVVGPDDYVAFSSGAAPQVEGKRQEKEGKGKGKEMEGEEEMEPEGARVARVARGVEQRMSKGKGEEGDVEKRDGTAPSAATKKSKPQHPCRPPPLPSPPYSLTLRRLSFLFLPSSSFPDSLATVPLTSSRFSSCASGECAVRVELGKRDVAALLERGRKGQVKYEGREVEVELEKGGERQAEALIGDVAMEEAEEREKDKDKEKGITSIFSRPPSPHFLSSSLPSISRPLNPSNSSSSSSHTHSSHLLRTPSDKHKHLEMKALLGERKLEREMRRLRLREGSREVKAEVEVVDLTGERGEEA